MSKVLRKIINTPKAPRPIGPYSQAVLFDKTLYVSGCLGLHVESMQLIDGGVGPQAYQALRNLERILDAAGTSLGNVIKTTIFLVDINDFNVVNDVYSKYFVSNFPARSTVQVGKLPMEAKVEIEVIAAVGELTL